MSRFHDAKFSKHVANWTFVDGVTPLYGDVAVKVRQLNHYRIVTVLVGLRIRFLSSLLFSKNRSLSGERLDIKGTVLICWK